MRSRVLLAAAGALVALAAPPPASAARLHRWTEDRWPEVYLLLRSRERVKGHRWIEIRLSRAAARPAPR